MHLFHRCRGPPSPKGKAVSNTASGYPYAIKYNGTLYYYITSLQGDVLHIADSSGNIVVTYSYDPYGKPLSTTGSMAASLGTANPLRYRGYYYDAETGFYYLQSRYYDPTTCRFINADSYVSTGQGIIGNNMFAYCNNNPVFNYDPRGTIPYYDDPLQKAIEDFFEWFYATDENETDENGNLTTAAKLKRTIISLIRNTEVYAGLGVGLGSGIKVSDFGGEFCGSFDFIAIQYSDKEWKFGQNIALSLSESATQAFEFGGGLNAFREFNGEVESDRWIVYNKNKESWTLFSFSNYSYFLGGTIEFGFNLNSFLDETRITWEK